MVHSQVASTLDGAMRRASGRSAYLRLSCRPPTRLSGSLPRFAAGAPVATACLAPSVRVRCEPPRAASNAGFVPVALELAGSSRGAGSLLRLVSGGDRIHHRWVEAALQTPRAAPHGSPPIPRRRGGRDPGGARVRVRGARSQGSMGASRSTSRPLKPRPLPRSRRPPSAARATRGRGCARASDPTSAARSTRRRGR